MINSFSDVIDYIVKKIDLSEDIQFRKDGIMLGLERAKVMSIIVCLMFGFFMLADITVFSNAEDKVFVFTIVSIHVISFVLAVIYLIFYSRLVKLSKETNSRVPVNALRVYIVLALLITAVNAINSQRLTGKIITYIMMIFTTSVVFPIEPIFMIICYITIHSFFLIGIGKVSSNSFVVISNQINSTSAVIGGIGFLITFYKFRKKEYSQRNKLIESERNFKKLFEINPLPLIISSIDDYSIVAANNRALEFYHRSIEELKAIKLKDLFLVEKDITDTLLKLNQVGSIDYYTVEQKITASKRKWVIASYKIIEYNNRECILMGVTDISEIKRLEEELIEKASTDELTGVLNRRSGMQILEEHVARTKTEEYAISVCFVDINNLKQVNDNYGHVEGDYLIRVVCDNIEAELSRDDTFFRYGGDEFVVIFPNTSEDEVAKRMYHIQKKLALLDKKPFNISISYGIYYCGKGESSTAKQAVDFADIAMYSVKHTAI